MQNRSYYSAASGLAPYKLTTNQSIVCSGTGWGSFLGADHRVRTDIIKVELSIFKQKMAVIGKSGVPVLMVLLMIMQFLNTRGREKEFLWEGFRNFYLKL